MASPNRAAPLLRSACVSLFCLAMLRCAALCGGGFPAGSPAKYVPALTRIALLAPRQRLMSPVQA